MPEPVYNRPLVQPANTGLAARVRKMRRRIARQSVLVGLCVGVLCLMALVAVFADVLAPMHYTEQDLLQRLKPPVFLGGPENHFLGTDQLGRDILSRLIFSIRISISLALVGTMIASFLGTLLGFVAASLRGLVEDLIMMLVDFQGSVPFLIIALAVLAFFGNNLVLFILLIGIHGWETYARLSRGLVLSAKERGYVVAVRTLGAGSLRVYGRHVLPNVVSALVVQITLNFPETILLETSLSFLGLGIQPPLTSLGLMLGSARDYLAVAWWMAVFPGMAIFLTTLSMSIVGDWLRDRLDPTVRKVH
jgi:peptide/nickel transport system permease protein